MANNTELKANQIYPFTSGEYEDYTIQYVVALQDFNLNVAGQCYIDTECDGGGKYLEDIWGFIAYLIKQGLIATYEVTKEDSIHLGAYSTLSLRARTSEYPKR
jgi:hypothetical protein